MKKILIVLLTIVLAGCVTVKFPKYLKDEFPYKKRFYAGFDETLAVTTDALKSLGWQIAQTSHPSVFEKEWIEDENHKQILIFTNIRQTPMVFSSRYTSLNVYLQTVDDGTDVEIRYLSIIPVVFKNRQNYKNDVVVYAIFDRILELLEK